MAAVPAAVAAVAPAPSLTLLLLLLLLLLRLLIRLLSTGQRRRIFLVASGHRMTCVSFTWDPTDQQKFFKKKAPNISFIRFTFWTRYTSGGGGDADGADEARKRATSASGFRCRCN